MPRRILEKKMLSSSAERPAPCGSSASAATRHGFRDIADLGDRIQARARASGDTRSGAASARLTVAVDGGEARDIPDAGGARHPSNLHVVGLSASLVTLFPLALCLTEGSNTVQ